MVARQDGVRTTDPHFDQWIKSAWMAVRLNEWECVLRLYLRSYARYQTTGTGLFDGNAYGKWQTAHPGRAQAVRAEIDEEWRQAHTQGNR